MSDESSTRPCGHDADIACSVCGNDGLTKAERQANTEHAAVEQKFREAKLALFALEEALGSYGNYRRREIYSLRCEVGRVQAAYLETCLRNLAAAPR